MQVIFFGAIVTSIIAYRISLYKTHFTWEAKLFLSSTASMLSMIFIAFFLAFASKYSLVNVCLITLMFSIMVLLVVYLNSGISFAEAIVDLKPKKDDINIVFLLVIIVLFLLYVLFPVYYMWGRRDPNVYFLMGTNIARNGTIIMPMNDLISERYDDIKGFAELGFRGFYPNYLYETDWSGDYSCIQAQFLHVFSAALAVGYSLGGIECMVRVPALIGIMALCAIYNFVSLFVGKKYGTFAVVLMGVCPAHIWGARITQTEELLQWIFILAAFIFAYAIKESNYKFTLVLVGILLGLSNLVRIDACLLAMGVLACACVLNFLVKEEANWNLMVVSCVITMSVSYFIDLKSSKIYISKHESYIYPVLAVSVLLLLCCIWIRKSKFIEKVRRWGLSIVHKFNGRNVVVILFVMALVLFIYLWFIRPLNQGEGTNSYDLWQRCFIELFQYIPLVFYVLFFVGILLIYSEWKRFRGIELFAVIGFVTSFVYIYKPAIAPDHIWASRRWETSVFPFIIIMAVLGIYLIEQKLKQQRVWKAIVSYGLVIYSAGFMLNQSYFFLFQPMLKDMKGQYEQLAENMDDNNLYFVEMSHFGAYLRFLYDKNVVVLNLDNEEAFWKYINSSDETVYYIGDINSLEYTYDSEIVYQGQIKGTYLEQTWYVFPDKLMETGTVTNIYEINAVE